MEHLSLFELYRRLPAMLDEIEDSIYIMKVVNGEFQYAYVNRAATRFSGITNADAGKTFAEKNSPQMAAYLHKKYTKVLNLRTPLCYEDGIVLPNGLLSGESLITPIVEDDGRIDYIISITRDITQRKKNEELLREYAYHDDLTGLYNRRYLLEHVSRPYAVHLFDLDHFKNINDTFGHDIGDAVLQEAAARLSGRFHAQGQAVVRLGGDEFLVASSQADIPPDRIAMDILELFLEPFLIHDRPMKLSVSIGVAVNSGAEDIPALLKAADIALYRAKGEGRKRFHIYEPSVKYDHVVKYSHELELASAIERCELELWYQPVYNTFQSKIVGAEALLRWNHARQGLLSPGDFIPVAEETGLIGPIGDWVLRRASADWHLLRETFGGDFKVSVNISRVQLHEPGFVERLLAIVRQERVPSGCIVLEITESTFIHDVDSFSQLLKQLRGEGFTIALDDFGTGYSSLSMLTLLPIDTLKIDRSFVHHMNPPLLFAILAMARALNLHVIAEGVEELEQFKKLVEMDCPGVQGYWISRPLKLEQLLQGINGIQGTAERIPIET
ncbi:EAL domain-containing protein [Paenibacillus filicis]|uniref:EAL domain-containing protein n=1 Tax=Paenibacillus gyeongsangnamensis TaxID=3388067 RepID=A0ABT4QK04_9BACL|nr:GGDEF domain-containing phosphodiesterase [Paenibacillus filicis]MCZ8517169.1 EAL domain-containing protein [Paenibacillus filicis]